MNFIFNSKDYWNRNKYWFNKTGDLSSMEKFVRNLFLRYIKEKNDKEIKSLYTMDFTRELDAIILDSSAILNIKNPSDITKLLAVKNNGSLIKYIDNPSELIQLVAIEESGGHAIKYIDNPSELIQLVAIEESNGHAIEFIENPTEKIQLEAIKRNPRTVCKIKNLSFKMKIKAIEIDPETVRFFPSYELEPIFEAKYLPKAYKYLKEKVVPTVLLSKEFLESDIGIKYELNYKL